MDPTVTAELQRRMGSVVRLYYRTRSYQDRSGMTYNVFGDVPGVDTSVTAHLVGRLMRLDAHHVIVHANGAERPVAVHRAAVQRVASPILSVR